MNTTEFIVKYAQNISPKNLCGIYAIECRTHSKIYIGQSSSIYRRWQEHKRQLRKGIHSNSHLQNSWLKYGEHLFNFYILEACNRDILNSKEEYYISLIDKLNCFNLGPVGPTYTRSVETRVRLSKSLTGRRLTDEHKRKLSETHRKSGLHVGKKLTDAHKKKIGAKMKGRKFSLEHKMKLSIANKKRLSYA